MLHGGKSTMVVIQIITFLFCLLTVSIGFLKLVFKHTRQIRISTLEALLGIIIVFPTDPESVELFFQIFISLLRLSICELSFNLLLCHLTCSDGYKGDSRCQ